MTEPRYDLMQGFSRFSIARAKLIALVLVVSLIGVRSAHGCHQVRASRQGFWQGFLSIQNSM